MTETGETVKRFGPEAARHHHYKVQAWTRAAVRSEPRTTGRQVSHVDKPATGYWDYVAVCWTRGEAVHDRDIGVINDIWIKLELNSGGFGYVSAIYLRGDFFANLPSGGPDCAACDRSECFD